MCLLNIRNKQITETIQFPKNHGQKVYTSYFGKIVHLYKHVIPVYKKDRLTCINTRNTVMAFSIKRDLK